MSHVSRYRIAPEDFSAALGVFADALGSGRARDVVVEQRTEFSERTDDHGLVLQEPVSLTYTLEVVLSPHEPVEREV